MWKRIFKLIEPGYLYPYNTSKELNRKYVVVRNILSLYTPPALTEGKIAMSSMSLSSSINPGE